MRLRAGRFEIDLARPVIMGVVNATPDSFSDGGAAADAAAAMARARRLVEEGAGIVDIGGESTRPGARPVDPEEELRRVLPVIEGLRDLPVPVSIDTRRARVMREAIAAGASMVNDIEALRGEGSIDAVRSSDCAVCLMHMQGAPGSMQREPRYAEVVREVREFLESRVAAAVAAGLSRERLVLDPGFGFGKTPGHNLSLLAGLAGLASIGVPLLVGLSRKSTLGAITGRAVNDRLAASLAAALIAVERGARIVRVHDVKETRDALAVWGAVAGAAL